MRVHSLLQAPCAISGPGHINQQRMITVDSDGNLHNCCVKAHDANKRGSLFDTDLEEFNRYRMEKDADCKKCKAHGHHVYAMQQYRVPVG